MPYLAGYCFKIVSFGVFFGIKVRIGVIFLRLKLKK